MQIVTMTARTKTAEFQSGQSGAVLNLLVNSEKLIWTDLQTGVTQLHC